MKKIFVLITILAISCTDPMDKKVYQRLSENEIKKLAAQDLNFLTTLNLVNSARKNYFNTFSETEKMKWNDLTYKRVHKFCKYITDKNQLKTNTSLIKEEWSKKYESTLVKIDSIADYWKKYENEKLLTETKDVKVPELVREYLSYKKINDEDMSDYYRTKIAAEILGEKIILYSNYEIDKLDSIYTNKDKLSHEFILKVPKK